MNLTLCLPSWLLQILFDGSQNDGGWLGNWSSSSFDDIIILNHGELAPLNVPGSGRCLARPKLYQFIHEIPGGSWPSMHGLISADISLFL